MAFRESDGAFMWQMVHDKLVAGGQRLAIPGYRLVTIGRRRQGLLRVESS
jgi:hypothetical protein